MLVLGSSYSFLQEKAVLGGKNRFWFQYNWFLQKNQETSDTLRNRGVLVY
ncbi:hypothetical protein CLOM621_08373 [Clostridium sp. M62/1]|nr:hypothetical protein CLOM621_08373 [Clostridium sp. M62/1]